MPGYKKKGKVARRTKRRGRKTRGRKRRGKKGGSLFSTGAATAALLFALNTSCKKRKKSRKTRRKKRK